MEWLLLLPVVELKKPKIEKKPFLEQVGDYMKSDVYMYSPIAGPPYSAQGTFLCIFCHGM